MNNTNKIPLQKTLFPFPSHINIMIYYLILRLCIKYVGNAILDRLFLLFISRMITAYQFIAAYMTCCAYSHQRKSMSKRRFKNHRNVQRPFQYWCSADFQWITGVKVFLYSSTSIGYNITVSYNFNSVHAVLLLTVHTYMCVCIHLEIISRVASLAVTS